MRIDLIERVKLEIRYKLTEFLLEQEIELYIAANDNIIKKFPCVELEAIEEQKLEGKELLYEIRVILGILGKSWRCDALINSIYYAISPYNITIPELTILLTSINFEYTPCIINKPHRERAIIRYIMEQEN